MTEETIKRRLFRAKKRAEKVLKDAQYNIIPSDNSAFCILAVREREIRMIRVVIDEITNHDTKIIKNWRHPGVCSKEIWCKQRGERDFEIREIYERE